jgi:hypothetical protein
MAAEAARVIAITSDRASPDGSSTAVPVWNDEDCRSLRLLPTAVSFSTTFTGMPVTVRIALCPFKYPLIGAADENSTFWDVCLMSVWLSVCLYLSRELAQGKWKFSTKKQF